MKAQRLVWALNRLPRFRIQTFKRLKELHINFSECEDSDILNLLGQINPNSSDQLSEIFNSSGFARDWDECRQNGIQMISIEDSVYPQNLAKIFDPPLILYAKGNFIPEDEFSIAIVGSRHPSAYGIRMAAKFSSELTERGMTIVSGFARGIDAEAHRSALRVKGRTIAVLGCGLDILYPKEHAALYQQIAETGAVISEFPLGTIPQAFNFPRRNRIITGLSCGVLVVEANQRSGSLITASIAAEEGREVYAVPGQADQPTARGTNHLIQNGAKLVISAEDILEDLYSQLRASLKPDSAESSLTNDLELADPPGQVQEKYPEATMILDETENSLLKLLVNRPLSFDEIAASLQPMAVREVSLRLSQLEVKKAVIRLFGGKYARTPDIAIT